MSAATTRKPRTKAPIAATAPATSLVLRTCAADMSSYGGFVWPAVGGEAVCSDWIANDQCGNGLHGWLYGAGDHSCSSYLDADSRWLVVEVESNSIRMLGAKCKFPRGTVRFVGDRKGATEYLAEHESRSAACAVIGACRSVGNGAQAMVGALGILTGGDRSTLTGGYRSTLTGGDDSTLTGGDRSTLTGGDDSTLTGGDGSTLTGGYGSTLTGGDRSTLTGGYGSTLTGGYRSTLTGGYGSTLTGGYRSTLTGGDGSTLTGGYGSTLTGGDGSTLTGGYRSTLTGGDGSTLTGGYGSTLTGGDGSTLTGGDGSTLTGGDGSTLTGGDRSTLTGGDRSELRFRYRDAKAGRYRTMIGYVGECGIEAGKSYQLDAKHEIVEVQS